LQPAARASLSCNPLVLAPRATEGFKMLLKSPCHCAHLRAHAFIVCRDLLLAAGGEKAEGFGRSEYETNLS
jgi:hypothetical protein